MIRPPATIYVATAPIDLRLSFDRLAGIVRDQLGANPRGEALYVFHNKSRTHLKMLWHDGTGYCVMYKRLDRGTYRIPLAIPTGMVSAALRQPDHILRPIDTFASPMSGSTMSGLHTAKTSSKKRCFSGLDRSGKYRPLST